MTTRIRTLSFRLGGLFALIGLVGWLGCSESPLETADVDGDLVPLQFVVRFPAEADPGAGATALPLRGGALTLDSVRTFAYELTGTGEVLRGRASVAILPEDEQFTLSMRVPPADTYVFVVQALGQDGPEENRTERGLLYHGARQVSDLRGGSNPPVEVELMRVAPRPRTEVTGGVMRLIWDGPEAATYQVQILDWDGSLRTEPVEVPRFPLDEQIGRTGMSAPAGEEPPHRVFRVRSVLPRGFTSAFSETLRVRVRVPARIDDLAATEVTTTSALLAWTATGDDGRFGQASEYDLRRSTLPITDLASFESATRLFDAPAPAVSGAAESYLASGLTSGVDYWFALRAIDDVGNESPFSNVLRVTTLVPNPGACCAEDGSCTVRVLAACSEAGGEFLGAGTDCDPNPCPIPGACCFPNGSCLVLSDVECDGQGGAWTIDPNTCDPNPCAQPTAACCFLDGSCRVLTDAECTAAGGSWQALITACTPNQCPQPIRACCFVDGTCVLRTELQCNNQGASWRPEDETCAPNPCPLPNRTCCFADGTCEVLTEPACDKAGGDWRPGSTTCVPNPCPVPMAVCCSPNGSCNLLTQANCLSINGTWEPDLSACLPNPCPPPVAVCCLGLSCTILNQVDCVASEGTWLSGQTACDPNPCDPVAVCCLSDGSCTLSTQGDCAEATGVWNPASAVCTPNPCPQPVVCCFADGTCAILIETECLAAGGTSDPEQAECAPNPCPQPVAACCFPDGSCTALEEADCAGSEGSWMPEIPACDPNPCPQPRASCCFDDLDCAILTEAECLEIAGIWLSEDIACSPNPCLFAPGACCMGAGTCVVQPESQCTAGVFQGPLSSCSPNPCPLFPDLTIVQVEFDPLEPACGLVSMRIRVRNQGEAVAAASVVRVRAGGAEVCSIDAPALNPGITVWTEFCSLGTLAGGTVSIEACADADGALVESNETNNCLVSSLGIPACPDLVVESIEFDPSPPVCDSPVRTRAIVRNLGDVPSGSFGTRFRLAGLTACTVTSNSLAGGASVATDWCDLGLAVDRSLEVEACADPNDVIGEGDEENNCLQSIVSVPPCEGWSGRFGPVPGAGTNGVVIALFEKDGRIYAGGDFTQAGGVAANRIAMWDGETWSPMGSGMDGAVWTIGEYNGQIIAGGQFETAGGVSVNSVALWNGSNWSPLGFGLPGYVLDTIVYQGSLYAGGYFPEFGSLARWTGTFWTAVGGGLYTDSGNGIVYSLETQGTRLYAGGLFSYAGGPGLAVDTGGAIFAQNIAAWNGSTSTWTALANGLGSSSDAVFTLRTFDGLLYAGGTFQFAGPTFVGRIAAWTGTSWLSLPGAQIGTNNAVIDLVPFNGSLAVGGDFTMAGGVSASRVARWTGSTWQAFDSGVTGFVGDLPPRVYRMTAQGTRLFVGGLFTTAGGLPSRYIARWDD